MLLGFTGEHQQKVDGKGRMSVPADFRRVLEAGDPTWSSGLPPRAVLQYGRHLKNNLQIYTVDEFNRIRAKIDAMPLGSPERKHLSGVVLGNSSTLDVDKDGRVVLPLKHREKLGLTEGELTMRGMGNYFEIWRSDIYEEEVNAKMDAWLATMPEYFDPLSLLGT